MEPAEYQRMFDLEDRHWWFQSRLRLVGRILRAEQPAREDGRPLRLLDLGCGTGMFLEREGADRMTVGLDLSRRALSFTRRRGIERLACGDSQAIPLASGAFDVVTAFDLIEHVDSDASLVSEVHRVLRPGGILLATVPAHPMLWGAHDRALHHKRRYVWRQFDALFAPDLWISRRMTYSFAAIFPIAFVVRMLHRLVPERGQPRADTHMTNELLNRLLIGWHNRVETPWIERFGSPLGLSLLTVRKKREESP